MDILSKIKQPIEGELIQLNEVIVQILSSTSPLLSRIVDHYLSMKLHSVERKLQLIWQTQAELHFLSLRKK